MSAISGINGTGQGLYQFIQPLSGTAPAQSTAATSAAGAADQAATQGVQGAHHHHGHGHGGSIKQIQDAVNSALRAAQSDGSSDPKKIVEDAIAKVLKNNTTAPANGASGQTSASNHDGDGDAGAAGKTDADQNSARQAFLQTLQSYGVSADQFRADFLAAVKDAQGGAVNPGAAFQSFPPGTTLDAIA